MFTLILLPIILHIYNQCSIAIEMKPALVFISQKQFNVTGILRTECLEMEVHFGLCNEYNPDGDHWDG
jgi:hypothetical protein